MLKQVQEGRFFLLVSQTTLRELHQAPLYVRSLLQEMTPECYDINDDSSRITELRDAYLRTNVVGQASLLDAEHIAAARLSGGPI